MFSNAELIALNQRGFIPGPDETEVQFSQRVDYLISGAFTIDFLETENPLSWHAFDWARSTLSEIFDVSPDWIPSFYSNKGLPFWYGGVTHIVTNDIPFCVLQLKKGLEKGKYLQIYDRDEIITHEAAHACRMLFNEPKTEELFAYWTATSFFRKIFGPLFCSPKETTIFMIGIFACFALQIGALFFASLYIFSWGIPFFLTNFISIALFRLFITRRKVSRCLARLFQLLGNKKKARAVLFRLTDKEISRFSKLSIPAIKKYVEEKSQYELRWKVLKLAYFS